LIDGETDLREFGFSGRVLPTPGHTIGSMSILIGRKGFVGDTLFGIRSETISPPFLSDIAALKKSWAALLRTDCLSFYPGHGKAIDRRRFENYFEKIAERKE
jgi:hydroxyacylglutathione hydrolase